MKDDGGEGCDVWTTKVGGGPAFFAEAGDRMAVEAAAGTGGVFKCVHCGSIMSLVVQAHAPRARAGFRNLYVLCCTDVECARLCLDAEARWRAVRLQLGGGTIEVKAGPGIGMVSGNRASKVEECAWGSVECVKRQLPAYYVYAEVEPKETEEAVGRRGVGKERNAAGGREPVRVRSKERELLVRYFEGEGGGELCEDLLNIQGGLERRLIDRHRVDSTSETSREGRWKNDGNRRMGRGSGRGQEWGTERGITRVMCRGVGLGDDTDIIFSTEEYEKTETGDAKAWRMLQERVSREPHQVLRYAPEGSGVALLWPCKVSESMDNGASKLGAPPCELCGGPRTFEFQIMPGLPYLWASRCAEYGDDYGADAVNRMLPDDWGSLAIFTCAGNCVDHTGDQGDGMVCTLARETVLRAPPPDEIDTSGDCAKA